MEKRKREKKVYRDEAVVTVAMNVKYYREKLDLNQWDLADRCPDVHYHYIGRVERCEVDVSLTHLASLAKGLGITMCKLVTPR